jgi:L-lactate dehydrogenase complex protein LldE
VRVGLFATCLVDLFRPTVGFAAAKLLQDAGCTVAVPAQTCCGQPAYNSGARTLAQDIARQTIAALEGYDHVVVPSGSCAGMMRRHYPLLLDGDAWHGRAVALARKTHELTAFLADVLKVERVAGRPAGSAAYHDSCSSLRDLGIKAQPRALLQRAGVDVRELAAADVCCGFGGAFCVKYPEISAAMADEKIADIESTGAAMVVAADLGCLLHLAGRMKRQGKPMRARHVAELLAGMTDGPAIGDRTPAADR